MGCESMRRLTELEVEGWKLELVREMDGRKALEGLFHIKYFNILVGMICGR